jgi:hypothetical protein
MFNLSVLAWMCNEITITLFSYSRRKGLLVGEATGAPPPADLESASAVFSGGGEEID